MPPETFFSVCFYSVSVCDQLYIYDYSIFLPVKCQLEITKKKKNPEKLEKNFNLKNEVNRFCDANLGQ